MELRRFQDFAEHNASPWLKPKGGVHTGPAAEDGRSHAERTMDLKCITMVGVGPVAKLVADFGETSEDVRD